MVAIISIVVGLIFFAGGMAIHPDFVINFVFFVGVFVAFIPQGLPSTVSIMLTYAAKKLTTRNVRLHPKDDHLSLLACLCVFHEVRQVPLYPGLLSKHFVFHGFNRGSVHGTRSHELRIFPQAGGHPSFPIENAGHTLFCTQPGLIFFEFLWLPWSEGAR